MSARKIGILILLCTILCGCAGQTMRMENLKPANANPIGLFICSSIQIFDDRDQTHRKFIIENSTEQLTQMLSTKYQVESLNDKINHDEVFTKYFGAFHIDEKLIAKIAKREGFKTCLVVYYAVTELNIDVQLFGVSIPIIEEHALIGKNDMTLHARCSLYGWLISTDDGRTLSSSHNPLLPFEKYITDKSSREQLSNAYSVYIKYITKEMFMPMLSGS